MYDWFSLEIFYCTEIQSDTTFAENDFKKLPAKFFLSSFMKSQ